MNPTHRTRALLTALLLFVPSLAQSQDAIHTGALTIDDEVVEIPLFLRSPRSKLVLESHSFLGGLDTQGESIAGGGFDVVLGVFDDTGARVGFHDDQDEMGADLDALLVIEDLPAGNYTISVSQFDSLPPENLATPFPREGQGNFTAQAWGDSTGQFWDVRSVQNTGTYTFEVVGAGCRAIPRTGCRKLGRKGKAKLALDAENDSVKWKWSKGKETSKKEFGKPTKDTDYSLCVYETDGEDEDLAVERDVQAGKKWKKKTFGFGYSRSSGNDDGVRKVSLTAGSSGKAKASWKSKGGPAVSLPLSDDGPVIAQLVSGEGACWEATFDEPSTNDGSLFKAKTP